MQVHTELSYYTPTTQRRRVTGETHPPSESSNIDGLYLTPEIFILPAFNPSPWLCSLAENRNAGIYLVALSHGQINVSRNSDTATRGELISPKKKKVITQQGSIKETTKTWIPGFQLHIEPRQQQQQTKGTGLASALNQGQMQLLQARMDAGGGWKRGAGSSRAKCSSAPGKGTSWGWGQVPNLLPLLHKLSWGSSP